VFKPYPRGPKEYRNRALPPQNNKWGKGNYLKGGKELKIKRFWTVFLKGALKGATCDPGWEI